MSTSNIKFSEININYLNVAPILEVFFEPKAIANPFLFFTDFNEYFKLYEKSFFDLYNVRKGKSKEKKVRFRFIKGLGELRPLSGHELKSLPIFREFGGKMSVISAQSKAISVILPMKIVPNWKIKVNETNLKSLKSFQKIRCNPLIKIYPAGFVEYQIRFYFAFKSAISLDTLILLLDQIDRMKILVTNQGELTVKSLIFKFHEMILKDFIIGKPMVDDKTISRTHRILTIKRAQGDLSIEAHKKELVGLAELESRWKSLSAQHIQKQLGKRKKGLYDGVLSGKYEGQFFTVLPSCTIIYPTMPWTDEKKKGKFDSIVKKIMRTNFTEIIEIATIQSQFTKILDKYLMDSLKAPNYTQTRKEQLEHQFEKLENAELLRDSEYLKKWLKGGHEEFYSKIEKRFGLKKRSDECLIKIKKIKARMKKEKGEKITVLFLASNPLDSDSQLLLGQEVNAIEEQMQLGNLTDKLEVKPKFDVQVDDITNYFYHNKPDIVHFSGHGNEKGEIIFSDRYGLSNAVPLDTLDKLFSVNPIRNKIRLVVLNACFTKTQAEVISKHIDCVIGMSNSIKDKVARAFDQQFYRNLAEGCCVAEAFTASCAVVKSKHRDFKQIAHIFWKNGKKQRICF